MGYDHWDLLVNTTGGYFRCIFVFAGIVFSDMLMTVLLSLPAICMEFIQFNSLTLYD